MRKALKIDGIFLWRALPNALFLSFKPTNSPSIPIPSRILYCFGCFDAFLNAKVLFLANLLVVRQTFFLVSDTRFLRSKLGQLQWPMPAVLQSLLLPCPTASKVPSQNCSPGPNLPDAVHLFRCNMGLRTWCYIFLIVWYSWMQTDRLHVAPQLCLKTEKARDAIPIHIGCLAEKVCLLERSVSLYWADISMLFVSTNVHSFHATSFSY